MTVRVEASVGVIGGEETLLVTVEVDELAGRECGVWTIFGVDELPETYSVDGGASDLYGGRRGRFVGASYWRRRRRPQQVWAGELARTVDVRRESALWGVVFGDAPEARPWEKAGFMVFATCDSRCRL